MTHYTPPAIVPKSSTLFESMRHTFAQFTDAQISRYRPKTDMQRSAHRLELARRGIELF